MLEKKPIKDQNIEEKLNQLATEGDENNLSELLTQNRSKKPT